MSNVIISDLPDAGALTGAEYVVISQGGVMSKVLKSALKTFVTQEDGGAGKVAYYARSTAPTGWLKANGAAISRTTYATLFSAIGTTFGVGDGSTTFNLPDLRGEFLRGVDDSRGVDTGRVFGSAQAADFLAHDHGLVSSGYPDTFNANQVAAGIGWGTNWSAHDYNEGGTETRPRNIALLACIKY